MKSLLTTPLVILALLAPLNASAYPVKYLFKEWCNRNWCSYKRTGGTS
jgi:hypothetical protein